MSSLTWDHNAMLGERDTRTMLSVAVLFVPAIYAVLRAEESDIRTI